MVKKAHSLHMGTYLLTKTKHFLILLKCEAMVWKKKKKDENVESSALNKDPSKQPQRQEWAGLRASFQNKENADEHIQNIKLRGQKQWRSKTELTLKKLGQMTDDSTPLSSPCIMITQWSDWITT